MAFSKIVCLTATLFLLLSTLLTVSLSQKSQEECTEENEFWGCQSPTRGCQRLCENRKLKPVQSCKLTCERACVCEAGYLRNGTDGACLYVSECPKDEIDDAEETIRTENRIDDAKQGNDASL